MMGNMERMAVNLEHHAEAHMCLMDLCSNFVLHQMGGSASCIRVVIGQL